MGRKLFLLLFLTYLGLCNALQRGYLYPHGRSVPDKILPPQDDVSSPELFLKTPIVFYNEVYNAIFVNSNGLLSFLTEVSRFYNIQFPLDYPVIAPLYSNVDVRGSGAIYYRESQDEVILDRATRTIRNAFTFARDFQARSVLVVTWEDVGYHKQGVDKVNTYQAVVISDGEDSFVELLYPDHGIQWVQGNSQYNGFVDAIGQAGFISGDGRMFTLKGSGSDQVRNLNEWTNCDNPGQWLFHVGKIESDGNLGQPDIVAEEGQVADTFCSAGLRNCHSRANCVDYETGYCCVCLNGFFGNGKNCLSEHLAVRVNGKVSGVVNGEELSDLDLQAYVVPADGRTYTAISVVPQTVGYDMQSLNILGTTIGWLFARPVKGAVNGFQLTGGVFNQTVTVTFPQTGHQLSLKQSFEGLDVFQQLTMRGEIRGTVPVIPSGSKIIIKDYEEQYTRTGLGRLMVKSSQIFQLEGADIDNAYTVEQTIEYDECAGSAPAGSIMRLRVVRTFIGFEHVESIIRYAMTSKITPLGVEEDPCKDGPTQCGRHSTCVVQGDTFRCVCHPGYEETYSEASGNVTCTDIDECNEDKNECGEGSTCVNNQGSFYCTCNTGYVKEGDVCTKLLTCDDINCDPVAAECVQRSRGNPQCFCKAGYHGDGTTCTPNTENPEPSCNIFGCNCPEGYDLDYSETKCLLREDLGQIPDMTNSEDVDDDYDTKSPTHIIDDGYQSPDPICFSSDTCACPKGYFYSSRTRKCNYNSSQPLETKGPSGHTNACIEVDSRCHTFADCVIYRRKPRPVCECQQGYKGDGVLACDPEDDHENRDECTTAADCVGEADCEFDQSISKQICRCHAGFAKDSVTKTCHPDTHEDPSTCIDDNDCSIDALCVGNRVRAKCQCNPGYEGDGKKCQPLQSSCKILNDCAPRVAECVYDEHVAGYRCRCRQGYQGDGFECAPLLTCRENPSLCGEYASCLPLTADEYSCQCNTGYIGNGQLCKPKSSRPGNFLLISQGMAILKVPFQPIPSLNGRPIIMQPFQQAIGIDTDCSEDRVYWSDITGGNIYSSDYSGRDLKTFIEHDVGSAEGLSIDWLSRNIFWTDSSRDTIEVASLNDGSLRKTIVSTGLVNPRGIAVHPSRGKVFWADWNRAGPKIEWANLDGSGRNVFLYGSRVQLPNSLVIDFSTDELCWADAGTFSIDCIGIENRYQRTVATNLTYPFGLTVAQDHYYWTDWVSQKIERATRPGQVLEKPLPPPIGSSGKLYAIVAVADSCPRLSNVCQREQFRCPDHHLCLLDGSGGRSCVCASPTCTNSNT